MEHCLFLHTPASLPAISLFFQFPSRLCPLSEGRACKRQASNAQGDSATDPLTGSKQPLKSLIISASYPNPPPQPLKLDPPICYAPSNSSVLCLVTIQMYCPEISGNARGYLFWFPSTVYAQFPWLSVGYLGYGQGRQWIGPEVGWIPWEAAEQGLVVSRMP